jgi:hypothetical protein
LAGALRASSAARVFAVAAREVDLYRGKSMTARSILLTATLCASTLAACGGAPPRSESGFAASSGNVVVVGNVADPGTKGPVLVFAYTDLAPNEDPATHEPASIATVGADGSFDLSLPPSSSLTLLFLADGTHDGVVDRGDSVALLTSPELSDLQAGDRVSVSDAAIDFRGRRITATVDVARAGGEPATTPTAVPAS